MILVTLNCYQDPLSNLLALGKGSAMQNCVQEWWPDRVHVERTAVSHIDPASHRCLNKATRCDIIYGKNGRKRSNCSTYFVSTLNQSERTQPVAVSFKSLIDTGSGEFSLPIFFTTPKCFA